MKECIAECSYTLTKGLFFEGMLCIQRNSIQKLMKICGVVMAALVILPAVFTLAVGGRPTALIPEVLVMLAFFAYALHWMPRSKAKRAWTSMQAQGKADEIRTIYFFKSKLQIVCGDEVSAVDYTQIVTELNSRNLLILIDSSKKGIMLTKDSLVGLSQKELLQVIRENGGLRA